MTYVETQTDAAFTLWLALRKRDVVEAERHTRLDAAELRMLKYTQQMKPKAVKQVKPRPKSPVRQMFTDRQIQIAMDVLARRESDTP